MWCLLATVISRYGKIGKGKLAILRGWMGKRLGEGEGVRGRRRVSGYSRRVSGYWKWLMQSPSGHSLDPRPASPPPPPPPPSRCLSAHPTPPPHPCRLCPTSARPRSPRRGSSSGGHHRPARVASHEHSRYLPVKCTESCRSSQPLHTLLLVGSYFGRTSAVCRLILGHPRPSTRRLHVSC